MKYLDTKEQKEKLQSLLGLKPDGIIGPKTIAATLVLMTEFAALISAGYGLDVERKVPEAGNFKDYHDLVAFAKAEDFFVTSTNGGKHNKGSKHYLGRAIDVRTWNKTPEECEAFMKKAENLGIKVRDERTQPPGQKVWSGPHIHLEV